MSENSCNTNRKPKKNRTLSDGIGTLLCCSIFLTGITSIAGIYFFVESICQHTWKVIRISSFSWKVLLYLSVFCCFVSLIKIAVDGKPFSKILYACIWIIGGMFLLASVLFPRLPDYQSSGFELFSYGSFVLIDGMILLPGLLLLLLGFLIREGLLMQEEIDQMR